MTLRSDATQAIAPLCPVSVLVQSGYGLMVTEATFICLLPEGHDGNHQDPAWGVWK